LSEEDLTNASQADLDRFKKVDVDVDGKLTKEGKYTFLSFIYHEEICEGWIDVYCFAAFEKKLTYFL